MVRALFLATLIASAAPKEELRFLLVHEQSTGTSCGYSVLSSLLTFYWNLEVDEDQLLRRHTDIGELGFRTDFASMAEIVADYGLTAQGFWLDFGGVGAAAERFGPVVVRYDRPDPHFSLLLATSRGYAIVADPAQGIEVIPEQDFMRRWSGAALLVSAFHRRPDRERVLRALERGLSRIRGFEAWSFPGR